MEHNGAQLERQNPVAGLQLWGETHNGAGLRCQRRLASRTGAGDATEL
jgi:hypothetical protein